MPQGQCNPTPEQIILDALRRAISEVLLTSLIATYPNTQKTHEVITAVRRRAFYEIYEFEPLDEAE